MEIDLSSLFMGGGFGGHILIGRHLMSPQFGLWNIYMTPIVIYLGHGSYRLEIQ
jgi:hypothetical protein